MVGLSESTGDGYLAFCLDRAVWTFGTCLEQDMHEAADALGRGTKRQPTQEQTLAARQAVFDQYMQPGDESSPVAPPKGRYADPMVAIRARQAAGR